MLKVVYTGKRGMVTDLGSQQCATDEATGKVVLVIDRYGVWVDRRGRSEVVATTADLEQAKRIADGKEAGNA